VASGFGFSIVDIGKVMEIFAAGPLGTSTNHQDLLGTIVNVVEGTNALLNVNAGVTSTGCSGWYGTNNAAAFQACIDAAPSNSVIMIPNGTYFVVGTQALDPNFTMSSASGGFGTFPSIVIGKGGLTLQGQSRTNTILLGCGAWQNKGIYNYRGSMFFCQGPVTNNGPLVFDNLTLDGGVQVGYTGTFGFPASTATGDGWDNTHHAVVDAGPPPLHISKTFSNCSVTRWRGEQFISVASGWDGFNTITNCSFTEGDATGINFSFSHNIDHCYFEHLDETMEFYQGYASNTCYFQNCFVTNMGGALMAINGAGGSLLSQVHLPPTYNVQSNVFWVRNSQNGIQTTPAQNLNIIGNVFESSDLSGLGIALGVAGYQGILPNSNIVVALNTFSDLFYALSIEGSFANAVYDVTVISNNAVGLAAFAAGYGWSTNIGFYYNSSPHGRSFPTANVRSGSLLGQWFYDAGSNSFDPWPDYDQVGKTNIISYAFGRSHAITVAQQASVFVCDDTHPAQVPNGAVLQVLNQVSFPIRLYLSASMNGPPMVVHSGATVLLNWGVGEWIARPER
jgi:hypothetical protein